MSKLNDTKTVLGALVMLALLVACSLSTIDRANDAGRAVPHVTASPYVNHADGVSDGTGALYQPCEHEYGQGPTGTYPCLWDAETMGNGQHGADAPRWTVWVRAEDGCPAVGADERCEQV